MTDVRVKLLLQGGHLWEFYCEEDDPIVFGLVSALPGANLDSNLPSDGLVQVKTRAGEQLFLTRSSLVSVNIERPSDVPDLEAKRLSGFDNRIPEGMSGPSAFALVPNVLPNHIHRALLEHALAQAASGLNGIQELGLGGLTQQVAMALRAKAEKARAMFGVSGALDAHARFKMFAVANAQEVPLDAEHDDILRLVYCLYKKPKMFTGGGVRLFDRQIGNGSRRLAFRDLEIEDNSLLMFPAGAVSAGLPVHCDEPSSADGLFVVYGALRRTAP
jgi:hypothetical protein